MSAFVVSSNTFTNSVQVLLFKLNNLSLKNASNPKIEGNTSFTCSLS